MNSKYKGWGIEYFGTGYRMTRLKAVNGVTVTKTAKTIAQAKTVITNEEAMIQRRLGKYVAS